MTEPPVEPPAVTPSEEVSELRRRLAEAEQQAAVAEAVAAERDRFIATIEAERDRLIEALAVERQRAVEAQRVALSLSSRPHNAEKDEPHAEPPEAAVQHHDDIQDAEIVPDTQQPVPTPLTPRRGFWKRLFGS